MTARDELADRFESHRGQLQRVAYRMLGSAAEAEDAVQEAWLRLERAGAGGVENLGAWLRTVVSRVCLDMLRSRAARPEDLAGQYVPDGVRDTGQGGDPEREAIQADSVGRALLVVLDRLTPDERVAFVLHDMFAVPFDEIAPAVDRTTVAAKKLASRARQRVRGTPAADAPRLARDRRVVEAFLAASRAGDVEAVMAVLAPGVVRRADRAAVGEDRPLEVRGARTVAREIAVFGRNSMFAEPALVNGSVGLVVAPRGRLLLAVTFTIEDDRVTGCELTGDPAALRRLDLTVLSS